MTRIKKLNLETLNDAQREVYEIVIASRTPEQVTDAQAEAYKDILGTTEQKFNLGGPFTAWMQSPELAIHAVGLAKFMRFGTCLPPRWVELAIITTARFWTAQYEWAAHAKFASNAGVEDEIIQAIKVNRRPDFANSDDEIIYELCQQLHVDRQVTDETYKRGVELVGERGVVELIALIGFYSLVSMTLNTVKVPVPEGEALPPI